jgi:2-C-methyl-D-erythritol 4-phosphate cytidylyltransferase
LRYRLVMPAAGSGQRFGQEQPKQYMPLAGSTVIECALRPFLEDSRCSQIVVALAAGDTRFQALPVARDPRLSTVTGGAERADSVLAGLGGLQGDDGDWVLVHDAARPCVTRAEIDALLQSAAADAGGGLLALPLADTLKREAAGCAAETPSRTGLWRALTPQMFRRGALRGALQAARSNGQVPTDESQAMEWMGQRPRLVPGSELNLKITTTGDLALAATVLAQRGGKS